jgi:general secretion pathway protein A
MQKLLPLVLAGQPELGDRLEGPELRQLKQRVTLRCELMPFDMCETASYIACRIMTAGGAPATMFSREAVKLIHESSAGIARSINVICDNALLSAMALGRRLVDQANVLEVCRELRLQRASQGQGSPPNPSLAQAEAPESPAMTATAGPDRSPAAGLRGVESPSRFGRISLRLGAQASSGVGIE